MKRVFSSAFVGMAVIAFFNVIIGVLGLRAAVAGLGVYALVVVLLAGRSQLNEER